MTDTLGGFCLSSWALSVGRSELSVCSSTLAQPFHLCQTIRAARRSHSSLVTITSHYFYGRGAGVGRTRGAGVALGIGVGEALGTGVGEADCAQYLPPVFVTVGGVLAASANLLGCWTLFATCPPQTIILLPVHTAV